MVGYLSGSRPASFAILFTAGIVVLGYYLLYLFITPDLHFDYDPNTGTITQIDSHIASTDLLRSGDKIVAIGGAPLAELSRPDAPAISTLIRNQSILLQIQRGSESTQVILPITNPDGPVYLLRTLQMLPSLIFLSAAAIVFLFIRPKTQSISLLLAVFSLVAIWLAARIVADYNLRWSEGIFRAAVWLLVPHTVHFAWLYPSSLRSISTLVFRLAYVLFTALALLDFLHLLPQNTFRWGILLSGLALPAFSFIQLFRQPASRRDLRILLISLVLVIGLAGMFALFEHLFHSPVFFTLSVAVLIGVPIVYICPILRHEMASFEVRANQALVLVSFTILTITLFIILHLLLPWNINDSRVAIPLYIVLSVLFVVLSVTFYPAYNTWAQRHLLGIHTPPRELINRFTGHITTSLEIGRLVHVLCQELAPSLLIRQILFLRLDENRQPTPMAACGTQFISLPNADDIPRLLEFAGRYLPHPVGSDAAQPFSQVRLVLKLVIDGQLVGLTLFGRRDPDDFYSPTEISVLQTLMDQTALALVNIAQAERLHALYQTNIQRTETERRRLAQELHDDVLGPLAVMMMNTHWQHDPHNFEQAYQSAASRIRSIIEGLRPTILDHSLVLAIEELIDRMSSLANNQSLLVNKVSALEVRYQPEVEMQVYRILQEACQNAILHGKANKIVISGKLTHHQIDLAVEDNGTGFENDAQIDLTSLLRHHHYGLAGIFERAALIGAEIKVASEPDKGTRISFHWSQKNNRFVANS
jgi:signal transduction histidine kinase